MKADKLKPYTPKHPASTVLYGLLTGQPLMIHTNDARKEFNISPSFQPLIATLCEQLDHTLDQLTTESTPAVVGTNIALNTKQLFNVLLQSSYEQSPDNFETVFYQALQDKLASSGDEPSKIQEAMTVMTTLRSYVHTPIEVDLSELKKFALTDEAAAAIASENGYLCDELSNRYHLSHMQSIFNESGAALYQAFTASPDAQALHEEAKGYMNAVVKRLDMTSDHPYKDIGQLSDQARCVIFQHAILQTFYPEFLGKDRPPEDFADYFGLHCAENEGYRSGLQYALPHTRIELAEPDGRVHPDFRARYH